MREHWNGAAPPESIRMAGVRQSACGGRSRAPRPVPPAYLNIAAVGARTAQALSAAGWLVTAVPEEQTAEGLVAAVAPAAHAGHEGAVSGRLPLAAHAARGTHRRRRHRHPGRGVCHAAGALDVAELPATGLRDAPSAPSPLPAPRRLRNWIGPWDRRPSTGCSTAHGDHAGNDHRQALAFRGFASVLAMPATLTGMAHTTLRLIQTRA